MLIVCAGPDTWRARKRARELVDAFKMKHDASGFSTEVLKSGDMQCVMNQIGAPSIFSPKRLIRCDGLLEGAKMAEIKKLADRIRADGENTIVLTVEDEQPNQKVLDEFKGQGFFVYPYPVQTGAAFQKSCIETAKEYGVDQERAKIIAARCDGDMWRAVSELSKLSANPDAPLAEDDFDPGSPFGTVDGYLNRNSSWRNEFYSQNEDQIPSLILTQVKNAIRIKSGDRVSLPPYVIKKLSLMDKGLAVDSFFKSLRSYLYLRGGFSGRKEIESIL